MINEVYSNTGNAIITFNTIPYSVYDQGDYTVGVEYNWGQPVHTAVTNFNLQVKDICSSPDYFIPNLNSTYTFKLGDPDTYMDLSTNYTYVPPSYCTCSVTLTAVKQTFPDTTLDLFVFSNILDASLAQIATFKIIVLI